MRNNVINFIQEHTAGLLSSDSQLSSIPIYPENRHDIEFQIRKALGEQGIVGLVLTPKLSYIGDYGKNSAVYGERGLTFEANPLEILFTENVTVNRAISSNMTCEDAGARAMQILGIDNHGTYAPIAIETGDDGSLLNCKVSVKTAAVDNPD